MIYINEFLPNPKGSDTKGEFVELYNSEPQKVSLNGYVLATDKKKASLSVYSIGPNGYLAIKSATIKLPLKNTAGVLSLYGPDGVLLDRATFAGSAPEGESFSRVDYGAADTVHFAFTSPTPGVKNKTIDNLISVAHYPVGVPLNHGPSPFQVLELILGVALILPALFIYVIAKNENLSQLFFKRHRTIR